MGKLSHGEDSGISEPHLKPGQLARRWNVSGRTLGRWRQSGLGPPYLKLVGRIVYRFADIEEYETRHSVLKLGAEDD